MSLRKAIPRPSLTTVDAWPWLGPAAVVALALATSLALLGLPPLDLHPPIHQWGIMDPLCGGTRAARLLMTGHWLSAWSYNPGIFAVAAAFGFGLLRWVHGRNTGHWIHFTVNRRAFWFALLAVLVVLDANQQLHADLLTTT